MTELTRNAEALRLRAHKMAAGGALAATMHGPKLVTDLAEHLLEMSRRIDQITPFLDEAS